MKPKKKPTQNGFYLYSMDGKVEDARLMYYENGKTCFFKSDINNPRWVRDFATEYDHEDWRFWGPVRITDAITGEIA